VSPTCIIFEVTTTYGVALVSRIHKIIRLFCKRALQKRVYSVHVIYSILLTVATPYHPESNCMSRFWSRRKRTPLLPYMLKIKLYQLEQFCVSFGNARISFNFCVFHYNCACSFECGGESDIFSSILTKTCRKDGVILCNRVKLSDPLPICVYTNIKKILWSIHTKIINV